MHSRCTVQLPRISQTVHMIRQWQWARHFANFMDSDFVLWVRARALQNYRCARPKLLKHNQKCSRLSMGIHTDLIWFLAKDRGIAVWKLNIERNTKARAHERWILKTVLVFSSRADLDFLLLLMQFFVVTDFFNLLDILSTISQWTSPRR